MGGYQTSDTASSSAEAILDSVSNNIPSPYFLTFMLRRFLTERKAEGKTELKLQKNLRNFNLLRNFYVYIYDRTTIRNLSNGKKS